MAQVSIVFQGIELYSIDGTFIPTSADDAVIVYSSIGGMDWTYVTDSYEDSVSWIAELPFGGGTDTRTFNYNDFPTGEFIKLEIVPGGCDQQNCSDIDGYDFYYPSESAEPYGWPQKLDPIVDSPTGNYFNFTPSHFKETDEVLDPGVMVPSCDCTANDVSWCRYNDDSDDNSLPGGMHWNCLPGGCVNPSGYEIDGRCEAVEDSDCNTNVNCTDPGEICSRANVNTWGSPPGGTVTSNTCTPPIPRGYRGCQTWHDCADCYDNPLDVGTGLTTDNTVCNIENDLDDAYPPEGVMYDCVYYDNSGASWGHNTGDHYFDAAGQGVCAMVGTVPPIATGTDAYGNAEVNTLEDNTISFNVNCMSQYDNSSGEFFLVAYNGSGGSITVNDADVGTLYPIPGDGTFYNTYDLGATQSPGTINFTPSDNWNGTDTGIQYYCVDKDDNTLISNTVTMSVYVESVNDGAQIALIPPITIFEDTYAEYDMSPYVSQTYGEDDVLTYSCEAFQSNVDCSIVDDTILLLTPSPGYNDDDDNGGAFNIVTLKVSDGDIESQKGIIVYTTAVNDPPELDEIVDQTINENETLEIELSATDIDSDVLTFSVEDGVNVTTSVVGSTLTITPPENWNGEENITVTVDDGSGGTDSETFTLTVNPVNDPPIIDTIPTQTIVEDTPTTINLSSYVSQAYGETDVLTYTCSGNSNVSCTVESANIATITLQSAPDYYGTGNTISFTADDGDLSTTQEFDVDVTSDNDPPVLTGIDDWEINENETLDIELSVTDIDSSTHTFTASSSNAGLVTTSISGTTLTLTTVTEQYGDSVITVYATDDGDLTSEPVTFTLTVNAINAQVSSFELIYTGDDTAIEIDNTEMTITGLSEDTPVLEVITITPTPTALFDIETSFSDLSFSVLVDDENLLTAEIDTSSGEALLSLTPKDQQYGTSSIDISITDEFVGNAPATTTTQTYTVTIESVFDRPYYHNELDSDDNYQIFGPMNQSETTFDSSTLDMGCKGHDPITQFKFKYEGEGTLSLEGTEYNSCDLDEDGYCEVAVSIPDPLDALSTNYLHSTGFNITYTPPQFFAGHDSFMWSCTSGHAATNTLGDWAFIDEPDNYTTTRIEVDYLETDVAFGYDDGLGITIEQSLSDSHDPMSGISVITDTLQNTKQSIEGLDFDKRPSLGMFYYDDNNPLRNEFTPNLPSPFTQITKPNLIENGNGRMVESLDGTTYTPRTWGYINMSGVKDNITYDTTNYMPYFIQDSAPNDDALLFAGYSSYTTPSTDNLAISSYHWAKWKKSTECYSYGKCLHFDNQET